MVPIVAVAARRPAVGSRRVDHRDGAGHLGAAYEKALRARARAHVLPAERAFAIWPSPNARRAGEGFVSAATGAEEGCDFAPDSMSPEERGGPFIATTGRTEFGHGADPSNPSDGTREPFPTT